MASARWISTFVFGGALLALAACGGDDPERRDAATPGTDSGMTVPTDTGPRPDAPGADAGPGGRMCGRHIPDGMCDVIAQDCPNATDGCYYGSPMMGTPASTICAPAGLVTAGMACSNLNDCQEGLFCNGGICSEYCCGGLGSDCSGGDICISYSDVPWLGECTTPGTCTIVPQDGCEAGEGCYVISSDGTVGCRTAGTVPTGGDCSMGACAPGNICVMPNNCARACRVSMGAADCGGTDMCGRVTGLGDIGVCPLPAG